ncbi:MAG: copper chaperone PCu(A)C [Nitrososphaerota archaeon]
MWLVSISVVVVAAVGAGVFLLLSTQGGEGVEVHGAFFRRGATGGGVFFIAHNHGLVEACIVGAEVLEPAGIRAELHRTVIENGVARMQGVEKICIPPRGEVRALGVEGDGYHIMLIGSIPEGVQAIKVRLMLSSGATVDFEAKEQRLETQAEGPHTGHD